MPRMALMTSGQPFSVRASGGSAGTSFGQIMLTMKTQMQNSAIWIRLGPIAPAYMSPTERPSWSARTTRTSDGGMSCVIVPDAAMTPMVWRVEVAVAHHDRQRDHAHGDHRGRDGAGDGAENRADEDHRIGEAAADRAEQLADRVSSRSSASPQRSRIAPMKVKNGIASSSSLRNDAVELVRSGCRESPA